MMRKTQTTMATFGNIIDVIDLTADSEDDAPPMKRIKILALRRVELQFQYDDSSVRPIRVTFALVA